MATYLSSEWFHSLATVMARQTPVLSAGGTVFVVEYGLDDVPSGCERVHTQTFLDGRLTDWRRGSSGAADVTLRRTYEVDRDDLLSRGHTDQIVAATELQSPDTSWGDVFGVDERRMLGVGLPDGLEITVAVTSPDTPFGLVQLSYSLCGDRLRRAGVLHPDLVMTGPYQRMLAWLHDDQTLLGHLLVCADHKSTVEGDYFKMSALEGCVSAPRPHSTWRHSENLMTYATCRRHSGLDATVDEIDTATL
jgi:hypothetical protein